MDLLLLVGLAVALVVPSLWGGGFSDVSRSVFVLLAGVLLLLVALVDLDGLVAAVRSPLALTLSALAALSLVSAAWTTGTVSASVRAGLVVGGYVAVLGGSRVVAGRVGVVPIAGVIALVALIEAVLGLRGVALHALPDAENLEGSWHPGGTYQYSPALAVLEVGSLPIFGYLLKDRRVIVAVVAGAGAVLAGGVIALADSRLALGLGAVFLAACIWLPTRPPGARTGALTVAILGVLGGLSAFLVFDGAVAGRTPPAGGAAFTELLAVSVLLGGAAVAMRRLARKRPLRHAVDATAVLVLALAVATAATALASDQTGPTPIRASGRPTPVQSDVLHGRTYQWLAAIQTWLDRPLLGGGAGTYYEISLSHQTRDRSLFAHDEPLETAAELGVVGLALMVALYFAAARGLFDVRREPSVWLLGAIVLAFLASNLVDWTWHLTGLVAIWAAAAGALLLTVRSGAGTAEVDPGE